MVRIVFLFSCRDPSFFSQEWLSRLIEDCGGNMIVKVCVCVCVCVSVCLSVCVHMSVVYTCVHVK